jgi:tetratricopeptide (TPR) repeat protein
MGTAYQKGLILFHQKRWRQAIEQFQLELSANPRSASTLSILALTYVNDKQIEPAFAAATEALRIAPEYSNSHYAMAHVLLRRKEKRPWWKYQTSSSNVQEYRKRVKRSRETLREAIRLNAFEPDYFEFLCALEIDLRRWKSALASAEQGLKLQPAHLGCANRRAWLLNQMGRTAEARLETDRAISINPEHAPTHHMRGWMLLQAGRAEEARNHFAETLRLDPGNRKALNGLRQARRARFAPYRWLLRFGLWSNLPANRGIVLIAGGTSGLLWAVCNDVLHLAGIETLVIAASAGVILLLVSSLATVSWRRLRARSWRQSATSAIAPPRAEA